MSDFDFSTLITDRTSADVSALSELMAKKLETWTPEELEKFNNGMLKGGYWWTDLNRVTACMEYLDEELRELGYKTGYVPVVVHEQPEPEESLLPDGYTRLQWIQSDGNQYILTDVIPTEKTRMRIVFSTTQASSCGVAVCDYNWKNRGFGVCGNVAVIGDQANQSINLHDGLYHTCVFENSVLKVDGEVKLTYSGGSFTAPCNISIFALNRNGSIQEKTAMTLKELSIDDFNFYPCKNQSGDVGLYCPESKKSYWNKGTGVFTHGPEIVKDPEPEPLDTYTWYKEDSPTLSKMEQYLSNVAALRSVFELQEHAPQTSKSMSLLTFTKANDIESVLQYIETTIQQTVKGMARSNSFTFWSGNRPFPTAYSNKGRDWDGLDEMRTGWRNWQLATWYLLLYGNLKAEGDVS